MESKQTAESTYVIREHTLKKYVDKGVYFTQPRLVAFYDYNYGKVTNSKRIKYFQNPSYDQYPLDLNCNLENYVRSQDRGKIEIALKYVMESEALSYAIENIDKTKVITRRGTLTRIMESFYNKNFGDITIYVSRYNGNLYMVLEEDDDTSLKEFTSNHTHHDRFQQLLFSDSPNKPTNVDEICDENIQLIGVHRSNFGKFDIIYSGEIQGIESNKKIEDFNDLEALNNCRYVFTKQMWISLRHKDNKYLKFWLQSYLTNVRYIYIGYKVDGFIMEPIECIKTADLPKNRFWNPSICTGFLYEFLQYVEKEMSSIDCLDTVYRFQYNPHRSTFKCERFLGKSDKTFISEQYKDYCIQ